MKFQRKHAIVLLAVAVWNVLTDARFTQALIATPAHRPPGSAAAQHPANSTDATAKMPPR